MLAQLHAGENAFAADQLLAAHQQQSQRCAAAGAPPPPPPDLSSIPPLDPHTQQAHIQQAKVGLAEFSREGAAAEARLQQQRATIQSLLERTTVTAAVHVAPQQQQHQQTAALLSSSFSAPVVVAMVTTSQNTAATAPPPPPPSPSSWLLDPSLPQCEAMSAELRSQLEAAENNLKELLQRPRLPVHPIARLCDFGMCRMLFPSDQTAAATTRLNTGIYKAPRLLGGDEGGEERGGGEVLHGGFGGRLGGVGGSRLLGAAFGAGADGNAAAGVDVGADDDPYGLGPMSRGGGGGPFTFNPPPLANNVAADNAAANNDDENVAFAATVSTTQAAIKSDGLLLLSPSASSPPPPLPKSFTQVTSPTAAAALASSTMTPPLPPLPALPIPSTCAPIPSHVNHFYGGGGGGGGSSSSSPHQNANDRPPARLPTPRVMTVSYRAPEVLLDKPRYGHSMDVWSTACMVPELVTLNILVEYVPANRGAEGSNVDYGDGLVPNIMSLFQVFGSPKSRDEWEAIAMPEMVSALAADFPKFRSRLAEVGGGAMAKAVGEDGMDWLSRMLVLTPEHRLTAQQALDHPWLAEVQQQNSHHPHSGHGNQHHFVDFSLLPTPDYSDAAASAAAALRASNASPYSEGSETSLAPTPVALMQPAMGH